MTSTALLEGARSPLLYRSEGLRTYPWFALRVRSNFEKVTSNSLRQRGFEEYFPAYKCQRRRSNRVKEIEQPLFPGYVFCRLNVEDRLPVLTTPGVIHIVGVGKILAPIDDAEVTAVQKLVESGIPVSSCPFLKIGQRVRIERGPLSGIEGILVAVKTGYRLIVSVSLLQRSVAAEIDGDWVRPISSTRSLRSGAVSHNPIYTP